MITFEYKKEGENFLVSIKTDRIESGTFYRMAAVIYYLGWDIISADIDTIIEEGISYSYDVFQLRSKETDAMKKAIEIGMLLETIFSRDTDIKELTANLPRFTPPVTKNFFREKAELLFEDDDENNWTVFYMEADSGRGLVYHVSKIFAEYRINVLKAIIETNAFTGRAEDTFYLQDENGKQFGKEPLAKILRKNILDNL
ncbi:MAG: hypothetical protein H7A25_00970 [Leptospiraceae bacterium]|nr:hypothetical protein [Leptospiraceae bacterium]MCP5498447.1 hypothetical protein [Leptospiraceae bacterium]